MRLIVKCKCGSNVETGNNFCPYCKLAYDWTALEKKMDRMLRPPLWKTFLMFFFKK